MIRYNLFDKYFICLIAISICLIVSGCTGTDVPVDKPNTINKINADIKTDTNGLTVEQRNIKTRQETDNKIGAIQHLYVFSAYSGQAIMYSTVNGKVTSSGKRLNPSTTTGAAEYGGCYYDCQVRNDVIKTAEIMQDDGTYGNSIEYLYWWDTKDVYHQHYVSGGQIIHISSQPMNVKSVIINVE